MNNVSTTFRVVCPPGCKHSGNAKMHEHEVAVDIDGSVEVQHETDFGEWAFGNVVQHGDGRPDERYVTVSPMEPDGSSDDPAVLRRFAADLLSAAGWLALVQNATT